MQTIELTDFDQKLPEAMAVSVVMQKTTSSHQWANYAFKALGVVVSEQFQEPQVKLIHQEQDNEKYLISGLRLQLHADECESYYHNLMSPKPGCFIVADETDDPDQMPVPYLVSLSFDEVHAYLEGGEQIFSVEIPPELYRWAEAFILTHYEAIKKKKRKLNNWKQSMQGNPVTTPGKT